MHELIQSEFEDHLQVTIFHVPFNFLLETVGIAMNLHSEDTLNKTVLLQCQACK